MVKVVGIILAGGRSRRFGSPKAFATYKGKSFIEHAYEALVPNVDQVITVSHSDFHQSFESIGNHIVIKDQLEVQEKGPLAGIYSAMDEVKADWYVVLPCDTPLINALIIKKMLEYKDAKYQALLPIISEKLQPLIAVYHHSSKEIAKAQLDQNQLQMTTFCKHLDSKYLSEKQLNASGKEFYNINTIHELDSLN